MTVAHPIVASQEAAGTGANPRFPEPSRPPFEWVGTPPDSPPPHVVKMPGTSRNLLVGALVLGSWLAVGAVGYGVWRAFA